MLSFNLSFTGIYILQYWVCISRKLNIYKVEQVDTCILHEMQVPYMENQVSTCKICHVGSAYVLIQLYYS